jgi:MinD-like ATPase involved in chromosome partitioning or flagellar assembly
MSTVHLTLQGKGGVGKSVVATLLAQYLKDKGIDAKCFDADPLNQTLAGFAALDVTKVDLMETTAKGRRINPRRFDDLVEQIALQPGEGHVIVDTGSSSFVALVHYLVSNDVAAVLSQTGHELVVHTVVTGGQALLDTLHGVAQLVKQLDSVRFVVWLNPFWGPVAEDGKSFEQMKTYQDIKKRIETVVNLPAFVDELFPQDIAAMLKERLTFREAIESPAFSLMSRHRLKVAQRDFYSRLDALAV